MPATPAIAQRALVFSASTYCGADNRAHSQHTVATGACPSSASLQDARAREQLWQAQASAASSTQPAVAHRCTTSSPLRTTARRTHLRRSGSVPRPRGSARSAHVAQRGPPHAASVLAGPSRVQERCNSGTHQSQSRPAARRSSTAACPRREARWLPQGRCAQRTRRMLRDARAVLPACAARPVEATELLGVLRCKPAEPNAALPAAMPAACRSWEATADFLQRYCVPAAAACPQQHRAADCRSRLLSSSTLAASRNQAGTAGDRPRETREPCGTRTCGRGAGRAATDPAARRAAAMV